MFFSLISEGPRDQPNLCLVFRREGERSILAESFSRMPFRSFPPFYDRNHGCAYTYVVNPTPGFLGGDKVRVEVVVGSEAHAFIAAPSALKILGTGADYAEQTTHIRVEDRAAVEYLPPYVIPFAGSRYRQKTIVHMGKRSSCLILDWFSTGRVRRGESLLFEEYDSATVIVSGNGPVVYDRFVLRPGSEEYRALGRLESHTVSACLYLIHDRSDVPKAVVEAITDALFDETILAGVSTIDAGGLVVRVMGPAIPAVQKTLISVIGTIRRMLLAVDDEGLLRRLLGAL
jgi:urease accessory protein